MKSYNSIFASIVSICFLATSDVLSQDKHIDTPFENGYTRDGIKIGKWKYYDGSEKLELIIDYDSSKVDFFKKDTTEYLINVKDEWQLKKVERPVYHIGPSQAIFSYFAFNLAGPYPLKARKDRISAVVILEIGFDKDGSIISKEIFGEHKEYFEKKLLEIAEGMPNLWMSAIYDNMPVAAKIGIPFVFKIVDGKAQPIDYTIVHNYKGKLLNEISASAHL